MIKTTKGFNTDVEPEMRKMYLSACPDGHMKNEIVCSHCKYVFCMNCSPSWSGQGGTHIECPKCGHYEEF